MANVIFDTLDCADVNSIPWLFNSRDAGFGEKHFTFRNVSLHDVRGHKTLNYQPNGKTVILNTRHTSVRDSGHYRLTLENVFIDGAPLTGYAQLKIDNPVPSENTVTVRWDGNAATGIVTAPATNSVRSVYPYKVLIGESLQQMRTQPVTVGSAVYLPYAETIEKLGLPETANPAPVTVNGTEMISAEALSAHFTQTRYDAAKGEIRLANVENTQTNLLEERSAAFSRWVEADAYEADLTTRKENGKTVYRIKELKDSSDDGMITFVTDEIKRNGPARYEMTFSARTAAGGTQTGIAALQERSGKIDLQTALGFGPEWKTYTVTFDIPYGTELRSCRDFYVMIRNDETGGFDVEVKEISLRAAAYHRAAEEQEPTTQPPAEPTTRPEPDPTPAGCSCNCHKTGIYKFLYKIQLFFWRLFGLHRQCACGAVHY